MQNKPVKTWPLVWDYPVFFSGSKHHGYFPLLLLSGTSTESFERIHACTAACGFLLIYFLTVLMGKRSGHQSQEDFCYGTHIWVTSIAECWGTSSATPHKHGWYSEDQWGNVRIVHIPVVPPRGFRALYSGGIVLRSPGDQLEEWHCYLEPRQGGARLSQCYLTSAAKALYQL